MVGTDVKTALEALAKGIKVSKTGTNRYQVDMAGGKDIRPEIFRLAVKKKWLLLTMKQSERQLEDVFAELTEME